MKILIEVEKGMVTRVWCDDPTSTDVYVRDLDNIDAGDVDLLGVHEKLHVLRQPKYEVNYHV